MKTRFIEGSGTSEEAWTTHETMATSPIVTVDAMVPEGKRCVVVAPHPDDEVLPCGGLLAELAKRGRDILIIALTDGERSHRAGSHWSVDRLRLARPGETRRAVRHLGLDSSQILRLGLPDGGVDSQEVENHLLRVIQPKDVLFTTWALDGHPDHEETSAGVAHAGRSVHAIVIEMPIWGWHWADPEDPRFPWARIVRLPISASVLDQKRRAMAEFQSQLEDDSDAAQAAILPPAILLRFTRPWETYILSDETGRV
jgi:LmbE family N-acetylglucosaminyl deacetylase